MTPYQTFAVGIIVMVVVCLLIGFLVGFAVGSKPNAAQPKPARP